MPMFTSLSELVCVLQFSLLPSLLAQVPLQFACDIKNSQSVLVNVVDS